MSVSVTRTTNQLRGDLAASVARMRNFRRHSVSDGKIENGEMRRYRLLVAEAASLGEAVENPKVARPLIERIGNVFSGPLKGDDSLRGYDSSQNGWWLSIDAGKELVTALRLLSMHQLHGAFSGEQDTFHVFQGFKSRFEDSREERKGDLFLQPAYGGLWLPENYMGPLLVNETGNRHLVPVPNGDRITLKVDWYPDDGTSGVEEVKRLLLAAEKLGYFYAEFEMPGVFDYKELKKEYGGRIEAIRKAEQKDYESVIARVPISRVSELVLPSALDEFSFRQRNLEEAGGLVDAEGALCRFDCVSLGFTERINMVMEGKEGDFAVTFGLFAPTSAEIGKRGTKDNEILSIAGRIAGLRGDVERTNAYCLEVAEGKGAHYVHNAITLPGGSEYVFCANDDSPRWGGQ